MQSLWLWVSNRGEQHSAGTRFCAAKSSVLYLLRPLTLERGCHRTGQTFSCGSRRTNSCKHGRLADIRSSGVGDAAKCRSLTETVLHRRGSKRYIKPAAAISSRIVFSPIPTQRESSISSEAHSRGVLEFDGLRFLQRHSICSNRRLPVLRSEQF